MRGLTDGVMETSSLMGCVPKSATYQQHMDVLLKHLRENPATRHESTVTLYHIALFTAFPCLPTVELGPPKK